MSLPNYYSRRIIFTCVTANLVESSSYFIFCIVEEITHFSEITHLVKSHKPIYSSYNCMLRRNKNIEDDLGHMNHYSIISPIKYKLTIQKDIYTLRRYINSTHKYDVKSCPIDTHCYADDIKDS